MKSSIKLSIAAETGRKIKRPDLTSNRVDHCHLLPSNNFQAFL